MIPGYGADSRGLQLPGELSASMHIRGRPPPVSSSSKLTLGKTRWTGQSQSVWPAPPTIDRSHRERRLGAPTATDSPACQRRVNEVSLAAGRPAVYPAVWVNPRVRDAEVGEIFWVRPGGQTPCYQCAAAFRQGAADTQAARVPGLTSSWLPSRLRRWSPRWPILRTSARPSLTRSALLSTCMADPDLAGHPGDLPSTGAGQPKRPRSLSGRAVTGVRRPAANSTAGPSGTAACRSAPGLAIRALVALALVVVLAVLIIGPAHTPGQAPGAACLLRLPPGTR
jgi:hypothetical protein